MLTESARTPSITLRIPGNWAHPKELMQRLPTEFRLTPDRLRLPDGTELEFDPLPPDEQFPRIFQSSQRCPLTDEELAILKSYSVNVCLTGPGGSMHAALAMMQAGSAIVRAGAAGVFIDNSALAHGGSDWVAMTDDEGPDAVSFAFAGIIRGQQDIFTLGMHAMGFPDLLMACAESEDPDEEMAKIIRYVCGSERDIDVGHILFDERGPWLKVVARESDDFDADAPMHNLYGRLKLTSLKDLADRN